MDFADVSAGGGDVLDNFDFDSFLNTDKIGMGFHFAEFDGGHWTQTLRNNAAKIDLTCTYCRHLQHVQLCRRVGSAVLYHPQLAPAKSASLLWK